MSIWVALGIGLAFLLVKGLVKRIISLPKTLLQLAIIVGGIYGLFNYIIPMFK